MRSLGVLWLMVLISLMGFGITTIPFPLVAEQMGASDFWKTFGGPGVFSLFQFLSTPLWGRLSDSIGRKPILLGSMAGSALAYLWLAHADSMPELIVARALGGIMSGNIAAAYAYASDVTEPQDRARGIGFITSAFGLGFSVGPFVGGLLGETADGRATLLWPSLAAAVLSCVALIGAMLFLKESLPLTARKPLGKAAHAAAAVQRAAGAAGAHAAGAPAPAQAGAAWRRQFAVPPVLASLVIVGLLVGVGGAAMQSVYPFWARDTFGYGPSEFGVHFLWLGGLSAIGQMTLVGPIVRRIGEKRAALASIAGVAVGFVLLAIATRAWELWLGLTLFGVALALFTPALTSLVSFEANPQNRGAVLGVFQASSAGGRILGPAISGPIYFGIGHSVPYLLSAALCVAGGLLLARVRPHRRPSGSPA